MSSLSRQPHSAEKKIKLTTKLETVSYVLFLFLIFTIPLLWGGNRPWFWLPFIGILQIPMMLWLCSLAFQTRLPFNLRMARFSLITLLLWLLYLLFQTVDLPLGILHLLSPSHQAINTWTEAFALPPYQSISINKQRSWTEIIKYTAYIQVFILTIGLHKTTHRMRFTLGVILIMGGLQAINALTKFFLQTDLYAEIFNSSSFYIESTFKNRNHLTIFLLMAFGICLSTLLHRASAEKNLTNLGRVLRALNNPQFLINIFLIIMMVFSIVAISSRGGIAIFVSSTVCMIYFSSKVSSDHHSQRMILAGIGFILIVVLLMIYPQTHLADRLSKGLFAEGNFGLGERLLQWQLSLSMITDYWLVGIGAGNYETVFENYRDGSLSWHRYEHAHNDYLEFFSENGLLGSLLLIFGIGNILHQIYRHSSHANVYVQRIRFVALYAASVMFLQAFIGFGFRIPALAIYFFVYLGLGYAVVMKRLKEKNYQSKSSERRSRG